MKDGWEVGGEGRISDTPAPTCEKSMEGDYTALLLLFEPLEAKSKWAGALVDGEPLEGEMAMTVLPWLKRGKRMQSRYRGSHVEGSRKIRLRNQKTQRDHETRLDGVKCSMAIKLNTDWRPLPPGRATFWHRL